MFKKKEYKKFINKLDGNLYEITGDIDVFKEFFQNIMYHVLILTE